MSQWWIDPAAPWRSALASVLFPAVQATEIKAAEREEIERVAFDHRLAPWIHATGRDPVGPWAAEARSAMALALHQQQTLRDLLELMGAVGIEPALLKGGPLSLFYYEQPWHRPMRDLDLLIEDPQKAVEAQRILLGNDYQAVTGSGDANAASLERHQLPVLIAPDQASYVELHVRLFHGNCDEAAMLLFDTRKALGTKIKTLVPEAQLIHLIGHAARDHRFDNGPQILVDIAMLRSKNSLDEDLLSSLLLATGLTRHGALLMKMASDAFPALRLTDHGWNQSKEAHLLASLAWKLMTAPAAELTEARDRQVMRGSSPGRIFQRLFPAPARLAGGATASSGMIGKYLNHYKRLANDRLPTLLRTSRWDDDLNCLIDWLEA